MRPFFWGCRAGFLTLPRRCVSVFSAQSGQRLARAKMLGKIFTFALVPLIWAVSPAALAQADKTLHVGILSSGILENRDSLDQALVQGLRDQGYVEGRNLIIERRYSSSKLRDNAAELAGMKL